MKLVIKNLSKTYPNGVQALKNVDLTIEEGMFGLLGPNGAGKSTLMRIIATLQEADEGSSVTLGDIDVLHQKGEVRKMLGYLPQEFGVYPKMEAEALLSHLAALKGITDKSERKQLVSALLQKTNLWSSRKRKLESFSGGMKQRFGIAQALIGNPRILIVDEPTAGLDPTERSRFLNLLSEVGEKTVVILSTHIVEDVKELCNSMAIIYDGRLLYKGDPYNALNDIQGKVWKKRVNKAELAEHKKNYEVLSVRLAGGVPEIHVLSKTDLNHSFERIQAALEDVYFAHILEAERRANEIEVASRT
ncbi:multidrug ABC transporter ATP-binding protein [Cytophagales bacterium WSM2-2]|nr:multidrug ABC transporter ATP-binding protein [Cytophagales bacterium WSM2-2]